MTSVVIDAGSGYIRSGFAGEDRPKSVIPCYSTFSDGNRLIGNQAVGKAGSLPLTVPIDRGNIVDFEAFESILVHIYQNELKVNFEDKNLLISETPNPLVQNRQELGELLFEKLLVPEISLVNQAQLALISTGKSMGTVVSVGDTNTYIQPIYESVPFAHALKKLRLGGRDINQEFASSIKEKLNPIELDSRKKSVCYVSQDFENESQKIEVLAPEILFQPSFASLETPGLHELIFESVNKSAMQSRKDLFGHVVVTGGTTKLKGFDDRLQKELSALVPPSIHVHFEKTDREIDTWLGGSLFFESPLYESTAIQKDFYNDVGVNVFIPK